MAAYQTLNLQGEGSNPSAPTKFKSPSIHRTALYRAKAAYRGMIERCENKNGKNPTYTDVKLKMTMEEWLNWAVSKYEKFLIENPNEQPSVSRYKDIGHYEIGNLEIISFSKNRIGQKNSLLLKEDGTKLCGRCKLVLKADSNFWKDKTRPDGFRKWCKECVTKHRLERKGNRGVIGSVSDF